jgi:hypothetical protein
MHCVCTYTYTSTYAYAHVLIHSVYCLNTHLRRHAYINMYVAYIERGYINVCLYIYECYVYMYKCICTHGYVRMYYVCMCAFICTYSDVCICVYV